MNRVNVIKELEVIKLEGNKYIICQAYLDNNLTTLLKTESKSFINFSFDAKFEFDYEEGTQKGLEEYNWSIVEQIVK